MADDVVVIKLDDDDDDAVDEALERLERLVEARGLGEVAGRMQGLGTIVFIDVAPKLQLHVEEVVIPALKELVDEVGLKDAVVEIPPEADDDDEDWDDDDDDGGEGEPDSETPDPGPDDD